MIKKLRAQNIAIDLPTEEGPVWVRAIVQTVYKTEQDYRTVQVIDRTSFTFRNIENIALERVMVEDPVLGREVEMSGAGCAVMIRKLITRWIAEDSGGVVNELGDIIIKE